MPALDDTTTFYASGDFDGDGSTDIVWKRANGSLILWLMNKANPTQPAVRDDVGFAPTGLTPLEP